MINSMLFPTGSGGGNNNNTDNNNNNHNHNDNSGNGNAGRIAGPVVGVVVGLALIAALVWYFLRRRRRSPTSPVLASTPVKDTMGPVAPIQNTSPNQDYGELEATPMRPAEVPADNPIYELPVSPGRK